MCRPRVEILTPVRRIAHAPNSRQYQILWECGKSSYGKVRAATLRVGGEVGDECVIKSLDKAKVRVGLVGAPNE